ncbi:MAG: hypothetical protein DHS20C01_30720 [marine bacterium B5-7]|nr:MAG: hypothetical protein DHS20C01_30720 [marine bacterium B5-7]
MQHYTLARFAPTLFVVLWSTGFVGAKFGLPYAEPATFLLIRFIIVAAILVVIVLWLRLPLPRRAIEYFHLSVTGILVHGVYLGGVFAAIHFGLNAGISALIVGTQPLLTAVMVGPLLGERISARQWLGFFAGVVGVFLVVQGKISSDGQQILGVSFCVAALIAISIGTVYQKRFCAAMDLRTGTLIQFVAAGIFIAIFAGIYETGAIEWDPRFIFALAWLCIVLSIGAITLLMWLIRQGAASHVASLFYLVPPLVAFEAWILFDETLDSSAMAGMVLCALGVWLVLRKSTPK